MLSKPDCCPVRNTLLVIGGKWKVMILYMLMEKTHRFSELKRTIPKITQKMLTQQLRELEKDGLVSRKVYPEVPPKVEYSLTEFGATLKPVFKTMYRWGNEHLRKIRKCESVQKDALTLHEAANRS